MSDPTMTNPNEPKISFNIKQPLNQTRARITANPDLH